MSMRVPIDPKLPSQTNQRLVKHLKAVSFVTREIQAPPILHYYSAVNQALSATTATKVLLDTKAFDTHGWWDATNNRYVPLRTGYYLFTWSLEFDDSGSSPSEVRAMLYNNFGEAKRTFFHNPSSTLNCMVTGSSVQYADGSARYYELWAYSQHATNVIANIATSYLCAAYIGDNALL